MYIRIKYKHMNRCACLCSYTLYHKITALKPEILLVMKNNTLRMRRLIQAAAWKAIWRWGEQCFAEVSNFFSGRMQGASRGPEPQLALADGFCLPSSLLTIGQAYPLELA